MNIRKIIANNWARTALKKVYLKHRNAENVQNTVFTSILAKADQTVFAKDNHLSANLQVSEFNEAIPVQTYESLLPYIERMKLAEPDILWPGVPKYFAKTSGTTAGSKYIPLSEDSLPYHISAARASLLSYIAHTGNTSFVNGKMIFLQGSPKLDVLHGIPCGRLSGIVYHHVPYYLQWNRLPSYETNCIEDWEEKVEKIAKETLGQNMTLISGIPPWVIMYFEKLLDLSGESNIKNIFPNLQILIHGGVNFQPYAKRFNDLLGQKVDSLETYPASEGFMAYQDHPEIPGLLLNIDAGMFFQFILWTEYMKGGRKRLGISEVKLNETYVLIITNNAGLFAYQIGDLVQFTCLTPFRIKVAGRVAQYISAFGEHVIIEEIESAVVECLQKMGGSIREFHVAPQADPTLSEPRHHWLIEWEQEPQDLLLWAATLDQIMQNKNAYYKDLIHGKIIKALKIISLRKGTFTDCLSSSGKLGAQNKVPRASNSYETANQLIKFS